MSTDDNIFLAAPQPLGNDPDQNIWRPWVVSRRQEGAVMSTSDNVYVVARLEVPDEFAEWFVHLVVRGQSGRHVIEPALMRSVELTADSTASEVQQGAVHVSC
ncbi:hypothetical protein [Kribbella jejuensis]|nr:hypothetical protein [Kribbella jejuensis]